MSRALTVCGEENISQDLMMDKKESSWRDSDIFGSDSWRGSDVPTERRDTGGEARL